MSVRSLRAVSPGSRASRYDDKQSRRRLPGTGLLFVASLLRGVGGPFIRQGRPSGPAGYCRLHTRPMGAVERQRRRRASHGQITPPRSEFRRSEERFIRWNAKFVGAGETGNKSALTACVRPERQCRRSDQRGTKGSNADEERSRRTTATKWPTTATPRDHPPAAAATPYHRQQRPNGYARAAPASTNGYRTQPKDRPPVRRTTSGTQPRKQRRGQGSLETPTPKPERQLGPPSPRFPIERERERVPAAVPALPQEEPTSRGPGIGVICEQLGDEDPRNRASAVQTLRLMTHHQPSQNPWGGPRTDRRRPEGGRAEQRGPRLVGLLSQESNPESQIAAADVLRQVVSTSRPQQQPQRLETVMREDITAAAAGMLGGDRERVRSSALRCHLAARAKRHVATLDTASSRNRSSSALAGRDRVCPGSGKPGDVDDAVGVLQRMLDDEQTSQEAKEAIVKRTWGC